MCSEGSGLLGESRHSWSFWVLDPAGSPTAAGVLPTDAGNIPAVLRAHRVRSRSEGALCFSEQVYKTMKH